MEPPLQWRAREPRDQPSLQKNRTVAKNRFLRSGGSHTIPGKRVKVLRFCRDKLGLADHQYSRVDCLRGHATKSLVLKSGLC